MEERSDVYFYWLDGDQLGKEIHAFVLREDYYSAQKLTDLNKKAIEEICKLISDYDHKFILSWGDKLYAALQSYEESLCKNVCQTYYTITGHSASLGIGNSIGYAYKGMKIAKHMPLFHKYFFLSDKL